MQKSNFICSLCTTVSSLKTKPCKQPQKMLHKGMCMGLLNGQKANSLHADCLALKMLGKSHMKPQDLLFLLFHHNVEDSQRLVTCSLCRGTRTSLQ